MAATRLYTAADLYEMEDGPQGQQYYIIDGDLFEDASAPISSNIEARLSGYLFMHVQPRGLGELLSADGAYILHENPDTILIPDISFIRADRFPPRNERMRYFRFAPDIAIEVLSPSNRRAEIDRKLGIYRDAGVPLVWLVDPLKQTVTVFAADAKPRTLGATDTLDGGDVLPDFTLPLAQLFA
jgi:Uma2 family endonuclease